MRILFTILTLLMLSVPAHGSDWTVEELQERLAEAKVSLQKYRAEYERLKTIGYGGPVLRKDLEILGGNVAALIHEIQGINKQLSGLEATPFIGEAAVSLKVTKESYDGPPLKGVLENGDIVALQGTVKIPGDEDAMLKSFVTWQLFDANGEQVADYYKREELWKTGEHKTKVRFLINELKSGQYTAALSHIPADNRAKMAQAKVSFSVSTPLYVNDAWITDAPGGAAVKTLPSDTKPYFYITFGVDPDIKKVNVQFRAWNTVTGKDLTLEIVDYEVKPNKAEQRIGIMLEEYAVKDASGVRFEARLTLDDGPPMVVERSVSIIGKAYALKLRATPIVMSGEDGQFSITLPEDFVPPYNVRFSSRKVRVNKSGNPLKGTYSGVAHGQDVPGLIAAIVTDSQGRRAEGRAMVRIKAADAKVLASQQQPELYDKPPASSQSSYSQPSGPDENGTYGSTGRKRISRLMSNIASGIGPPCARGLTGPYQSALVDQLQRVIENDAEMVKIGKMSSFEYDAYIKQTVWKPLAKVLAQAVAASPESHCNKGLLQNYVGLGYITQGEANSAVASSQGGGSGSKPPAGYAKPAWMQGGTSQPAKQQKQCTKVKLDLSHCESAFYACMKRCPTTGTHDQISSCHQACGDIDASCKKQPCPNGSISGVGWNVTCTTCQ